ncbi:MAG: hypothetical protein H6587_07495 [Flavobacteriales bacterium]|nr:hypothetical protein [Flavobacteriales bacterium]MCB9364395.1 hypothetical protein [Flavobacteriales bacterium]
MKRLNTLIIAILFWVGCNSPSEDNTIVETQQEETLVDVLETTQRKANEVVLTPQDSFLMIFSSISEMQKTASLSSLINENYGVYIISSNGAMPKIEKSYELNAAVLSKKIASEAVFEELPKVVCEDFIYNKQGCFAQEVNPLLDSQIWNYTDLNEKEKQALVTIAETIKYTVIDTDSYTYYFSIVENKWVLTFVDVRIPCQG